MKPVMVPHLIAATVLKFARIEGYDVGGLSEGLRFASKKLWWPGARVPWDGVVELFSRMESRYPDALRKFAAYYVLNFPLLNWLATYVFSPEHLYRLVFYAWDRVWPFHITVRRTTSGYEVDAEISPALRGGDPIFRLGAEILRQLPSKFNHEPARVDVRMTSHRCTWIITLSREHRGAEATDDATDATFFQGMARDVFPALAPPAIPEAWALTRAEVRVVRQIVAGLDVKQIAQRFCVDQETIRTHLKRAMAKAGVRRQAELVARVLSQREAS